MNNLNSEINKINIFNFQNLTDFLKTHYTNRKDKDPQFTYEEWSYSLGFKSRSFMYLVTTDRRSLSNESADALVKYFKFNDKEKDYFYVLVNATKKENKSLKKVFSETVMENLNFNEERLEITRSNILLNSKTLPLIKVLLACQDIVGTKNDIQKYINIDDQTLACDLDNLVKYGFVTKNTNADGIEFYKSIETNFKVPDSVAPLAIKQFHNNVLNETIRTNQNDDVLKSLRSLMLILSENDFENLKQDTELFINKIKNKYLNKDAKSKDLFRFNIQTYKIKQ